ncbi:MAG: GNAT family N-acetyltransferase [Candidatus Heimdallarchaeota archaeon]|nr:GNAT family N-acetyltransferase [Candidatus Heimdallarchaeota archaeon]MCK4954466.1 GNAT family N-acetyltransferase [Candidatus Heimdallarchaeota archaeon]
MFKTVEKEYWGKYKELFGKHKSVSIFNYAFSNQLGKLEVDNFDEPKYAKFSFTNFMFFAGKADENIAEKILQTFPPQIAIVVEDKDWYLLIETYFSFKEEIKFSQQNRIKFSSDSLTLEHLLSLKKPLPEGFHLKRITKSIKENIPSSSNYHIKLFFGSDENFLEKGMGFCVLDGDKPICIASSFIPIFENKLEIQIDTLDDPKYRRKGFATAACVALLEYCLENKITPDWDAQNEASVGLAKKLGYTEKEKWKLYYYIESK